MTIAVAGDQSVIESIARFCGKGCADSVVFKLLRIVAIRCSLVFADAMAFLVSRLHIYVYAIHRIGVSKEFCLQLRSELMGIAVVVCYAKRALLTREESLG